MARSTGLGGALEEAPQSPPFEPPTYNIKMGPDKTLQWDPPVDSEDLAWALSYHFPKQSTLEDKMRAAMREFKKSIRSTSNPSSSTSANKSGPSTEPMPATAEETEGTERTLRRVRGQVSSARISHLGQKKPSDSQHWPTSASPSNAPQDVRKKPKAEALTPVKFTHLEIPGMSTFKLENGERHGVKSRKRRYSDRERIQVANNRGNVCSFHKKRKQKCDPAICRQNRQCLDRVSSSSSPPNENPLEESCTQSSSSSSSYLPTTASISEVDSKPLTAVTEPTAAEHNTTRNPEEPSTIPWYAIESYLQDSNDPYMGVVEAIQSGNLSGSNFEDFQLEQFINPQNIDTSMNGFQYPAALPGSYLEFMNCSATDSGAAHGNGDSVALKNLETTVESTEDFKEMHCMPLKISVNEITAAPDGDAPPVHSIAGTKITSPTATVEDKWCNDLTRPPAGCELSSLQVKAKVQPQAPTSGGQGHPGRSDCDRSLVEPYPHPPATAFRERHLSAKDQELANNDLYRRCSTVSTASTRHSYNREMYDGVFAGVFRRSSAMSSTSQSSRSPNTSHRPGALLCRRDSDELRRQGSHNSATSSRREGLEAACDLRRTLRGENAGIYNRYSLYSSSQFSKLPEKSPLDELGILVSKMEGASIHC